MATQATFQPASPIPSANLLTALPHVPKPTSQSGYNMLPAQELRSHSTPYVHTQVYQHQHTHQHTHQYAITPLLHRSSDILPALSVMGTQGSNLLQPLSRRTQLPSLLPFKAFLRSSHEAVKPQKPRKWGAMHVCIAWQIHHHKQRVKNMPMKPNPLHLDFAPECLSVTNLTDSIQRNRELNQPFCIYPNPESPRGQPRYENVEINVAGMKGTAENISYLKNSRDQHYTLSPEPCPGKPTKPAKRERPDWEKWAQPLILPWDIKEEKMVEKEKHREHNLSTSPKAQPVSKKSLHQTRTPELDSGHRKRELEYESHIQVKRVKRERGEDDRRDSCHSQPPHQPLRKPSPLSRTTSVQHIPTGNDTPALYPVSSGHNEERMYSTTHTGLISCPGTEKYPYLFPSWEPMLNIGRGLGLPSSHDDILMRSYSVKSCEGTGMQDAEWTDRQAYHGFQPPRVHCPVALREQEGVYLKGTVHSLYEHYYPDYCHPYPCHSATTGAVHQSGFQTTLYPRPRVSRVRLTPQRAATSVRFTHLCP